MKDYSKLKLDHLKPGRLRGVLSKQGRVKTIISEEVKPRKSRKTPVKK